MISWKKQFPRVLSLRPLERLGDASSVPDLKIGKVKCFAVSVGKQFVQITKLLYVRNVMTLIVNKVVSYFFSAFCFHFLDDNLGKTFIF